MARIPEEEIERIKLQTDLKELVRSRGIELYRHGGNGHFAGKCPFHDEDEASFIITPAKGLFHCMGCGAAGNAIQFVERFDGVSFRHAFELLNNGTTAFDSAPAESLKRQTVRRLPSPVTTDDDNSELLQQVVDYYHTRLLDTPAALDYLKGRGLFDEQAIQHFKLGFGDRTLGLRLPISKRVDGREIRTRLQKLGLIRKSGHEHFTGSIIVPVYDDRGQISEIYGRKVGKPRRGSSPQHLYLPGPHVGIWNSSSLSNDEAELILCEAPLDALTFWVNGFHNVTFIYGTQGFPDYMLETITKHGIKSVRIAYDADQAGNRAAARDAERLQKHGIEAYRVKFPWGMDANEYAGKVQPSPKALGLLLKSSEWLGGTHTHTPAACHAVASRVGGRASSLSCLAATSGPEPGRRAAKEAANEKSQSVSAESASSAVQSSLTRHGDGWEFKRGSRIYRIRGLERNQSLDVMKISLRIACDDQYHVDTLDLLRDTDRRRFIERGAEETKQERDTLKSDLGRLLFALEDQQNKRLAQLAEPQGVAVPELTEREHEEALAFLRKPDLLDQLQEAFDAYGLVSEEPKRLAAYLACTSRKLDRPLAVIIQSTSAAGKTTLMEAVLSMFPDEDRVQYSAMTGQSLYYLGKTLLSQNSVGFVTLGTLSK